MTDITRGDVEGVRQDLLKSDRLDDASAEYRAGWIDALIAMDLALTDPEAARDDRPSLRDAGNNQYGVTDD